MVSQLFKADIKGCGAGIERRELQDQSRKSWYAWMPLLFCRVQLQPISSLIRLFAYLHVSARTKRVENSQVGGKEEEGETTFLASAWAWFTWLRKYIQSQSLIFYQRKINIFMFEVLGVIELNKQ